MTREVSSMWGMWRHSSWPLCSSRPKVKLDNSPRPDRNSPAFLVWVEYTTTNPTRPWGLAWSAGLVLNISNCEHRLQVHPALHSCSYILLLVKITASLWTLSFLTKEARWRMIVLLKDGCKQKTARWCTGTLSLPSQLTPAILGWCRTAKEG